MSASLTDLSPMPFGIYRGQPMQEVPTSYCHWLWQKCGYKHDEHHPVAIYIRNNLGALQKENSDLIWT